MIDLKTYLSNIIIESNSNKEYIQDIPDNVIDYIQRLFDEYKDSKDKQDKELCSSLKQLLENDFYKDSSSKYIFTKAIVKHNYKNQKEFISSEEGKLIKDLCDSDGVYVYIINPEKNVFINCKGLEYGMITYESGEIDVDNKMWYNVDLSEYYNSDDEHITWDDNSEYFQQVLFNILDKSGNLSIGDILADYFKILEYGKLYTNILKDNNTYIFIVK